ncbi:MAG: LysR substrate-binding domain-containing protein, partial [Burkholderiaceae bacterium]
SVPADTLRVNSALMMQAMLAQSDRLALMSPRQVEREIAAGLLVQLPLAVQHAPRRIGLIRRGDFLPTAAAQLVLDTLAEVAGRIDAQFRP